MAQLTKKQKLHLSEDARAGEAQPLRAEGQADPARRRTRTRPSARADAQRRAAATRTGSRPPRGRPSSRSGASASKSPSACGTSPTWAACRRRRTSRSASARSSTATARSRAWRCCARASTTAWSKLGFDADAFVHELTDSIIGDNYPVPDRMLTHCERIVHEYLVQEMCDRRPPRGKLRPVRGRGRHRRHVLHLRLADHQRPAQEGRHDRARHAGVHALSGDAAPGALPVQGRARSTPPRWRRRATTPGSTRTRRSTSWPTRRSRRRSSSIRATRRRWPCAKAPCAAWCELVKTKRPDLMILTDDVYGTFVDRLPLADGRAAAQHHRRLLVLQVLRLHRLAAGRDRDPPEERLRREARRAARRRAQGAQPALRHASRCSRRS